MGWLDDLKKGFQSGHENGTRTESQKTERLYAARERGISTRKELESLNYESDSVLFNKLNSIAPSKEEKKYIEGILISRGYKKNNDGSFDKL